MISIIAAVGENLELGKNGDLIWHLKKDLANFKKLTMGKKVIMGTGTYKSLPKKLEGRTEIILSHSMNSTKNLIIYNDFEKLLEYVKTLDEEVFIIGGASIYKLFLPYAKRLFLTEVNAQSEADVYFPKFVKENYQKTIIEKVCEGNISYDFVLYERK